MSARLGTVRAAFGNPIDRKSNCKTNLQNLRNAAVYVVAVLPTSLLSGRHSLRSPDLFVVAGLPTSSL
jgi:hypothetical protein